MIEPQRHIAQRIQDLPGVPCRFGSAGRLCRRSEAAVGVLRRRIGSAAMVALLAGCSVNEIGLVKTENIVARGAAVQSLSAPGLHLELTSGRPSATIGSYRRTIVSSAACSERDIGKLKGESADGSAKSPVLAHYRIAGLNIAIGQDGVDVTLGIREQLHAVNLNTDADMVREIHFDPHRLNETAWTAREFENCQKER